MRVILVAPGISVHTQRFLQLVLDAGHDVTLVDSYNPRSGAEERYRFIRYPGMFGLERLGLRTANRLGHRIKAFGLRRIWRRIRPDVVHVHWLDARAYQCVLAGLRPLVLTCWGSDVNNLFSPECDDEQYRSLIGKVLRAASHVTADSPEVLRRCEELAGRSLSKSLFYFGIDLGKFRPGYTAEAEILRHRLGIQPDARVVLSVRALRPAMGHHHIIEAFSRLTADPRLNDVVLVLKRYLPFEDGYEQRLIRRVQELHIEGRVRWLGPCSHDEMPAEYALADVVVSYADRDGFPVTFFEAAACKRFVIASKLPAYHGSFVEGVVRFVQPADPARLAEALVEVLTTPADGLRPVVEEAYRRVQEVGDAKRWVSELGVTYRRLVFEAAKPEAPGRPEASP